MNNRSTPGGLIDHGVMARRVAGLRDCNIMGIVKVYRNGKFFGYEEPKDFEATFTQRHDYRRNKKNG